MHHITPPPYKAWRKLLTGQAQHQLTMVHDAIETLP